jgi:hypothetical protein
MDRSRTVSTKIPITFSEDGCPDLPKISMYDNYKTKTVQSMLREYCTAHIREHVIYILTERCNIYSLGFKTGNKGQVIFWGSLVQDPTAWISEDCIPPGFEWKDPSKIQIGEIFRLLDHWMDRQDEGLDALVWVTSCPLFKKAQEPRKRRQSLQHARASQEQISDEENFDLPSSGDPDDADDESDQNMSVKDLSDGPGSGGSQMKSPKLHRSHLNREGSGTYDIHTITLNMSHILM